VRERAVDDRQDAAEAREELEAVVDADESVVAGLRGQVVSLHHVAAGRRDSREVAHAALHEGAEVGAVLLPAVAGLDAAELKLALCGKFVVTITSQLASIVRICEDNCFLTEAGVLGHIAKKDLLAQHALRES